MTRSDRSWFWASTVSCLLTAVTGLYAGHVFTNMAWRRSAVEEGLLFRDKASGDWRWSMRLWFEPIDDKSAALRMEFWRPIPPRTALKFAAHEPLIAEVMDTGDSQAFGVFDDGSPAPLELKRGAK